MTIKKTITIALAASVAALAFAGTAHAGDQIGSGDEGGHVSDESHSVSVSAVGDALFSGDGNTFSSATNILGAGADSLF